jgi:hypothetical protein
MRETMPISSAAGTTSVGQAQSGVVAPSNAQALRDAAFNAHVQVQNADGYKTKREIEPGSGNRIQAWLATYGTWDASRMMVVPEKNVRLYVVEYEYHSGKGMEAWADSVPANGILELRFGASVSGHNNLDHKKLSTNNIYEASISGPSGSKRVNPFGPGVSKIAGYASLSDVVSVDISKPGDYHFTCSPLGSAGTGGFNEARSLVLHITGNERKV